MAETSQYDPTNSSQEVMARLDRLEATVNRILRLQRFDIDDFTVGEATFASTQSGTCSARSYGCTIGVPPR